MPEASTQVNMVPPWGCNICLEETKDPVCTSCGHIFCWPCLYPWVHDLGKPCPVCRTPLSLQANIVAVYGSPVAQSSGEGSTSIPPRPHPAVIRPPPPPPRRQPPPPLRQHDSAGEDQHRVATHPHQVTHPPPHDPFLVVIPPQPPILAAISPQPHLVARPPQGPHLVIAPPRLPPRQTQFGASRELQFRRRVRELQLQRSYAELEVLRNAEWEQHRVTTRRRSHATRLSSHTEQTEQHH